jgi:ParB/RepB/Spo0J family partition protein
MATGLNSKTQGGGGALGRLASRAAKIHRSDAPTVEIDLSKIVFDPEQPRQAFHAFDGIVSPIDQEKLQELAASIKSHGLIHPVTVSELPDGRYLVRVGERRTRACMLNGDKTIKAQVRNDLDGIPALALQLAENTDRQELTDREIADTIARLLTPGKDNPTPMTKAEVAKLLGKSPGWVTRYLAFGDEIKREKWVTPGYVETPEILYLLSLLPDDIQELIYADMATGKISPPLRTKNLEFYKSMAKDRKAAADNPQSSGQSSQPSSPGVPPLDSAHRVDMIAAAMAGKDAPAGMSNNGQMGGQSAGEQYLDAAMGGGGGIENPPASTGLASSDGYQLPDELAETLRVPTFTSGSEGGAALRSTPGMMVNTAVPCRIPMKVLGNLLALYGDTLTDMSKIEAEVRFPSALAVKLVREMTGQTVEEDKVAVLLAKALTQLK